MSVLVSRETESRTYHFTCFCDLIKKMISNLMAPIDDRRDMGSNCLFWHITRSILNSLSTRDENSRIRKQCIS